MPPDPERLMELYHDKDYSMRQVASEYDVAVNSVTQWFDKYDIPTRSRAEATRQYRSTRPAAYFTSQEGYEQWAHQWDREQYEVYVHRLVAVAQHGLEAVQGSHVHHRNGVPWDNRPENLEVLSRAAHLERHRDDEGQFALTE